LAKLSKIGGTTEVAACDSDSNASTTIDTTLFDDLFDQSSQTSSNRRYKESSPMDLFDTSSDTLQDYSSTIVTPEMATAFAFQGHDWVYINQSHDWVYKNQTLDRIISNQISDTHFNSMNFFWIENQNLLEPITTVDSIISLF
jgi:hypothetical protein